MFMQYVSVIFSVRKNLDEDMYFLYQSRIFRTIILIDYNVRETRGVLLVTALHLSFNSSLEWRLDKQRERGSATPLVISR
jgi:hypothetical protein